MALVLVRCHIPKSARGRGRRREGGPDTVLSRAPGPQGSSSCVFLYGFSRSCLTAGASPSSSLGSSGPWRLAQRSVRRPSFPSGRSQVLRSHPVRSADLGRRKHGCPRRRCSLILEPSSLLAHWPLGPLSPASPDMNPNTVHLLRTNSPFTSNFSLVISMIILQDAASAQAVVLVTAIPLHASCYKWKTLKANHHLHPACVPLWRTHHFAFCPPFPLVVPTTSPPRCGD